MSFGFGFALPHWQTLSGGFSPASLFAGGTVQGAWYDPSDSTTIFEDTAGTIPCRTPGATVDAIPVGLMLDKSQGLALGSEAVTNGGPFTATTGWTGTSATLSVVSSNLRVTNTIADGGSATFSAASPTIGKWYKVQFTIVARTVSYPARIIFGGNTITGLNAGTYTYYLYATTTAAFALNNGVLGVSSEFADYTNISVKELAGNHAIAWNNSTACPVLSARVNLLTYSEQFDNAAWTRTNVTVDATGRLAPDGTNTADLLYPTATSGSGTIAAQAQSIVGAQGTYTASYRIKPSGFNWAIVAIRNLAGTKYIWQWFNIASPAVGSRQTNAFTLVSATIVPTANGYYVCTLTVTTDVADSGLSTFVGMSDADNNFTTTANGTNGIIVWGADLRPTNIGTSVPAYQRIADQYTYDSSGFPRYLVFNGTASGMYTPASIPFATVTSDGQARRNLLNNPTQFDISTVWLVSNTTVSANATTAPDSSSTADLVYPTTSGANRYIYESASVITSTTYTNSIYVKYSNIAWINLTSVQGSTARSAWFNVQTGQKGTVAGGVTADIVPIGNNWYRCSVTDTSSGVTGYLQVILASADNSTSVTANGTDGVFLWGAQLETGSTATAFQNIGTDKATVFAGARKLVDTPAGSLVELSASPSANTGIFALSPGDFASGTGAVWLHGARGTAAIASNQYAVTPANYAAPISNVLTGQSDIGASTSTIRANGTLQATATGAKGTGNFGSYPLYIGSRNNTLQFFNGYLYSLLVVGSSLSAAQISSTESWINVKEGGVY